MQLVERLEYHLQKIQEGQAKYSYVYSPTKRENIEICINPNTNELRDFLKSQPNRDGCRGLVHNNTFYFWNQYGLLHQQVAEHFNLRFKSAVDLIARSFEITNHNSIHNDHWDKIGELQGEMTKAEFFSFLAKCLNTLKILNSDYHTQVGNLREIAKSYIYHYYEHEIDSQQFLTKQQRHNVRKERYDRQQSEYADLFKRL